MVVFFFLLLFPALLSPGQVLQTALMGTPAISITFTPVLDGTQTPRLNVALLLHTPVTSPNNFLIELPIAIGNVPTQAYNTTNPILAEDDLGNLELMFKDDPERQLRRWHATRPITGNVRLAFVAIPRVVDNDTPIGPRLDLRAFGNGLLGAGLSVLPLPPDVDSTYRIGLCWDLSHTARKTIFASSFGENDCEELNDKLQALQMLVFAVGNSLQRHPAKSTSPDFALFYFRQSGHIVPFDVPTLSHYIRSLHTHFSAFFTPSIREPYHVFLRPSPRAFGGAGFKRGFMLEYHEKVDVTTLELQDLLAHEIVHNWPIMDFSQNESLSAIDAKAENTWFNEGIATYYATFLPFRLGLESREDFVAKVNRALQAYYTSPARHLSNVEAAKVMWANADAQRLPYFRSTVYFIRLAYLLHEERAVSGRGATLDGLVRKLLDRRRHGLQHDLTIWQSLVSHELGAGIAQQEYAAMTSGGPDMLVPQARSLEYVDLQLGAKQQEELQLGFATSSFNSHIITDLLPDSRAQEARIREGDQIVEAKTMYWQVADDLGRNMTLLLRHTGHADVFNISYWPRAKQKLQSWQVLDRKPT
ncbi:hypothetical protein LTR78_005820 [Recurvomyces mirabilis]|uniref:PDZ domain-containing protein n=1 Tax=Recurvomyces mirabilis TaxID=574656 RepID=A0AAE1C145_9PEZI|nr:hypothetical protein LTR78_005820 [Recurvomyces mirabilis]KAK5154200.1 hypothetical protein LTS14_006885 [Recurvomyces mirabilis]